MARLHVPPPDDPLIVLVIDEMASLTSDCPNKKIRDRIPAGLSLILSQGRAAGFLVIGALQDPLKEILPFRDLFTTRIALRLTEDEQVDMVLGDGARDRGALCDLISPDLPGVAYMRLENHPDPVRVRLAWVTDQDIADACRPVLTRTTPDPRRITESQPVTAMTRLRAEGAPARLEHGWLPLNCGPTQRPEYVNPARGGLHPNQPLTSPHIRFAMPGGTRVCASSRRR
jgi:DNA segregation ATPase FtsK/SpoIIIE-like protein